MFLLSVNILCRHGNRKDDISNLTYSLGGFCHYKEKGESQKYESVNPS